jgi:Tetracyclin repressor-like, C-terminal domain
MRKRAQTVLANKIRALGDEVVVVDPDAAAFVMLNAFMGPLMAVQDDKVSPAALEAELVALFTRYLRLA